MVTIAVTGHMDLADEAIGRIRADLRELLADLPADAALVGRSCLARGADTLFAEEILSLGGRLSAIIPSRDYREAVVRPADLAEFDALRDAAAEVVVLPYEHAGRAAYEAANRRLLQDADRLVAIWDGQRPHRSWRRYGRHRGRGPPGRVGRRRRVAARCVQVRHLTLCPVPGRQQYDTALVTAG